MKDFKFELEDTLIPNEVIENRLNIISEQTKGYVEAHIEQYGGKIRSYIHTRNTGLFGLKILTEPVKEEVDIQDHLGEQGNEMHKYEVYLSVRELPHYKYRIMFVGFGSISYPATVVINEDIAEEIYKRYAYVQEITCMKELEELLTKILESDVLNDLIQNLIYEAIRLERRNKANPKIDPPEAIGRIGS